MCLYRAKTLGLALGLRRGCFLFCELTAHKLWSERDLWAAESATHQFADKISSILQTGLENRVKLSLGCKQTPAAGESPLAGSQPMQKMECGPSSVTPAVPLCTWRMAIPVLPSAVDVVKGT